MSAVIAIDIKGNKHFVTKSKIEVESSVFVGDYCVREAYYKKLKKELLMLIEKDTVCIWVVVKVKSYYQKISQYSDDKNETEFKQCFKLFNAKKRLYDCMFGLSVEQQLKFIENGESLSVCLKNYSDEIIEKVVGECKKELEDSL